MVACDDPCLLWWLQSRKTSCLSFIFLPGPWRESTYGFWVDPNMCTVPDRLSMDLWRDAWHIVRILRTRSKEHHRTWLLRSAWGVHGRSQSVQHYSAEMQTAWDQHFCVRNTAQSPRDHACDWLMIQGQTKTDNISRKKKPCCHTCWMCWSKNMARRRQSAHMHRQGPQTRFPRRESSSRPSRPSSLPKVKCPESEFSSFDPPLPLAQAHGLGNWAWAMSDFHPNW